jgi:hypothetical protein
MFETLGVKASLERTKGFLNATCTIPWNLFKPSVEEATSTWSAETKYTQAPQPGDILRLALKRSPRGDWDATAGWSEPEWAMLTRRAGAIVTHKALQERTQTRQIAPRTTNALKPPLRVVRELEEILGGKVISITPPREKK